MKYDISKPLNHFLVLFQRKKRNIPESFNLITPVYPSSPKTKHYGASSKGILHYRFSPGVTLTSISPGCFYELVKSTSETQDGCFELSSVMKTLEEFNCS
ncbi:hypothetical protein CEXT_482331 [Caerostris extrusa]|uniref:Uncharacterized protein n=1 Tax=Caerostris extrusa TaxID=172846 RepID=A0AAV4P1E0_CAEEX|nr:hypothetical protein CEXT_482331 [Caerostris extrusa]